MSREGKVCLFLITGALILGSGCHTTHDANYTDQAELEREGSIVFVRPDKYSLLGTRSIRDYVEVTYEEVAQNSAGYPVLTVGLRNRGGQHFWDTKGPEIQLSVQTAFYSQPTQPGGASSRPTAYRSNWQTVKLVRGQTTDYRVSCPVKGAKYYQVTISEFLK